MGVKAGEVVNSLRILGSAHGEEAAESNRVEGDSGNEECMGESHCSYRADPGVITPPGSGNQAGASTRHHRTRS